MCGRGDQSLTWEQICDLLQIIKSKPPDNMKPNYNVAPTHDVLICSEKDGKRQIERMRWGLVPVWAKEPPKYSTINAKCETIEEKATWKGSLNKMRCVIPFNSFYEWRGPKRKKQPYCIQRRDGKPMLIAGLWAFNDKIDPEGLRSFTVITCPANKTMGAIHNRMPVILSPDDLHLWLGVAPWGDEHRSLMRACPDDWLTAFPVSKDVGSVKNNRPDLIDPIGDPIF